MRIYVFFATLFVLAANLLPSGSAQKAIHTPAYKPEEKFARGERLTYKAHYGILNAAEAVVSLDTAFYNVANHVCYKVDVDAKTTGSFALLYNVNNLYRSFFDTSQVVPQKFYRNVSENKYQLEENVWFDHQKQQAKVRQNKKGNIQEKEYKMPRYAKDIVSGYYYLRTLDFNTFQRGDTLSMDAFFENEVYDFKIIYMGKTTINTAFGKIGAIELAPVMPENNSLFRGKHSVKFWISDDANRVPLKIKAKIFVGAFEIELTEYEGLRTALE